MRESIPEKFRKKVASGRAPRKYFTQRAGAPVSYTGWSKDAEASDYSNVEPMTSPFGKRTQFPFAAVACARTS